MNEQHVSAWGSVWFQLTLPIRDAGERLTLRYISSLCAILPYVASQTATHSDQLHGQASRASGKSAGTDKHPQYSSLMSVVKLVRMYAYQWKKLIHIFLRVFPETV